MTDVTIDDLRNGQVETPDAELRIDMGDAPLGVGQHRFELTVEDTSENESIPFIVNVVVTDTIRPTAIVDVRDRQGRVIQSGRIPFGQTFVLDASRSNDIGGGTVNRFIWRLEG